MPEFFNVLSPDEARSLLLSHLTGPLGEEVIPATGALGRITSHPIYSPHDLPQFRRSTMDGYAVRASDTFGARESLPAFLRVVGEVAMGGPAEDALTIGEAVLVHTGGMVPQSADAVVEIEATQLAGQRVGDEYPHDIEVLKAVAAGDNTLKRGEDVGKGDLVLPAGHPIRPQDIGGLLALGIAEVAVARQPRVAILATGDEVINPKSQPRPGQIRDINSYTVAAQSTAAGGVPILQGIIADEWDALLTAAGDALETADMLVVSAGSSVSVRDMTAGVIDALGSPGVIFHGVATRPGKPTIAGIVGGKPVLGLPGNPVSAMIQFDMLGVPAIYRLQGAERPAKRQVVAELATNIASVSGREDYVPVVVEERGDLNVATPVFGKSNLIYTLVRANGLACVPLNNGGLRAGQQVVVDLF